MQYLKRLLVEVAFYNKFPRNISEIFSQETFLLLFSSTNNKILLIACFLPSQTLRTMITKVSVRVSTKYDKRIELLNVFSRDRQLRNICRCWKMSEWKDHELFKTGCNDKQNIQIQCRRHSKTEVVMNDEKNVWNLCVKPVSKRCKINIWIFHEMTHKSHQRILNVYTDVGGNMYFTSKRPALNFAESNSTIIPNVHHEITQVTWRCKKLSAKIIWQTSSLLEEDDINDRKFGWVKLHW